MRIRFFTDAHISFIGAVILLTSLAGCAGGGGSSSSTSTASSSNPLPSLSSISPTSAPVGSPDTGVTLTGSGFIKSSMANLDGRAQTTIFASSTELSIMLPGTSLAQAAAHSITVTNPSPGGGTSAAASFSVNNLAPVLASVTPSTVAVGTPSTQVELDGSNFLPASTVTLNSSVITSKYVSATEMVATLPAASLGVAGTPVLNVVNPVPGGGGSNSIPINVTNSVADLTPKDESEPANPDSLSYFLGLFGAPPAQSSQPKTDSFERTANISNPTSSTGWSCSVSGATSESGGICIPGVPAFAQMPPGSDPSETANCGLTSYLMVRAFYRPDFNPYVSNSAPQAPSQIQSMLENVIGQPGAGGSTSPLIPLYKNNCSYVSVNPNKCGDWGTKLNTVVSDAADLKSCVYYGGAWYGPLCGFGYDQIREIAANDVFAGATNLPAQGGTTTKLRESLCPTWTYGEPDCSDPAQLHPVIVHVQYHMEGQPIGGHYMVVIGMDDNDTGNIYVNDPYDPNYPPGNFASYKSYPIQTFLTSWGVTGSGNEYIVVNANGVPPVSFVANSINLPPAQVGSTYNATVSANFGNPPYQFSGSNLPPGLSISTTGTISGVPTMPGTFQSTLQVTDSTPSFAQAPVMFTVGSDAVSLTVTTGANLTSVKVGEPVTPSVQLTAAGGIAPYHWSVAGSTCPNSISGIDGVCVTDAGVIQGTPTSPTNGAASFNVQVTDSSTSAQTASENMNLTVLAANIPPQVYSVTGTPATVSAQGTSMLTCTAVDPQQDNLTYAWSFTGGTFSGGGATVTWTAPSTPGSYTATCTATSSDGLSASGSTVMQVSNAALSNSISPTSGIAGVTQFTVSGSGATPSQGVTATITTPNATTTTSHTTANSSGQYSFGPFSESATGIYSEVDSDDHTGGKSNALAWTVTAAAVTPTVSQVLPIPVPALNSNQTLTINGSNFVSGATVTYYDPNNNPFSAKAASVINSGQIVDTAFDDAAESGTWKVTVTNQGGSPSAAFSFNVGAVTPTVSQVLPIPVPALNSNQTLTINGSNFVSGATVTYYDPNNNPFSAKAASVINSGQIVDTAFDDAAESGTWKVTVTNQGGSPSAAFSFNVGAVTPTVSQVLPIPVPALNSNQTLTINGSNFVSGATVTYYDPNNNPFSAKAASVINSGQIVDTAFDDAAESGTWKVTVTNQGGSPSAAFSFNVGAVTPTVSQVLPIPVPALNSNQTLTINGSNFVSGATVTYYDPNNNPFSAKAASVINSGQIVDTAFDDAAESGTWKVTVTNQGGSPSAAFSFNVGAVTPTVSQVLPIPVPALNSNQTLTINGSNFVSGATVTYYDPNNNPFSAKAASVINSGQIVDTAFDDAAESGTWKVTVTNQGGSPSAAFSFNVE